MGRARPRGPTGERARGDRFGYNLARCGSRSSLLPRRSGSFGTSVRTFAHGFGTPSNGTCGTSRNGSARVASSGSTAWIGLSIASGLMRSGCSMTSRKRQSKSSLSSRRIKRQRGLQRRLSQPRRVALAKVKDDLSRYLKLAADQEILITRHGRPAGVLIGFKSEDDWFEYRLENHPEFLRRIQAARQALQAGLGTRLEDVPR